MSERKEGAPLALLPCPRCSELVPFEELEPDETRTFASIRCAGCREREKHPESGAAPAASVRHRPLEPGPTIDLNSMTDRKMLAGVFTAEHKGERCLVVVSDDPGDLVTSLAMLCQTVASMGKIVGSEIAGGADKLRRILHDGDFPPLVTIGIEDKPS